jgi:hypothetical protein
MQEAARAAYVQSKANPQLIIVLMPVSGFAHLATKALLTRRSAKKSRFTRRSRLSLPSNSSW